LRNISGAVSFTLTRRGLQRRLTSLIRPVRGSLTIIKDFTVRACCQWQLVTYSAIIRLAFVKTIREVKSSYTEHELLVVEKNDERVRVIFNVYDELMKTGNY